MIGLKFKVEVLRNSEKLGGSTKFIVLLGIS